MAEKIVSPGVFTKEIDASFLPAAIGEIGACIIGPTVKGPALVPTVVNNYSEFQAIFGDSFKSGSQYHQYLTSHAARNYLQHQGTLTVCRVMNSGYAPASASIYKSGSASDLSFVLTTLGDGAILNNSSSVFNGDGGILDSGSANNIRWDISNRNTDNGTFTLLIRRGDDINKRKAVLESWNNLSLDPNSSNYISKLIGDQYFTIDNSDPSNPFLKAQGEFTNKSKYVRVTVHAPTVDYFDENGNLRDNALSQSLPNVGSGSEAGSFYGGLDGSVHHPITFNENIAASSQGFNLASSNDQYLSALNLLGNQDEYDFNLLLLPGIVKGISSGHSAIVTKAVDICEKRGDAFTIVDVVGYTTNALTTVTEEAKGLDSNYAATYWPWLQVPDNQTGKNVWVPPSVVMGGIYAFNDKVGAPWFAPAGLTRGLVTTAVQAKRKLTLSNRDTLYEGNVNPIATFPGEGVVVWGQKTLQKKASALDRVNVRRLLIKVKKFIASSSRFLVFEQNNDKTRAKFLAIANPFLQKIQEQAGLNAFKVIMDSSNNTPDLVDRNILYGQIFVQPTKTAEFISLDFTIQPTGATFPE